MGIFIRSVKEALTKGITPRSEILKGYSEELNDRVRILGAQLFLIGIVEGFLICLVAVAIWNIAVTL
jgi:hypothetical protein